MPKLEEIEKLFRLKEKGIISEEEFKAQKAILLNSSSASVHISPMQAYKDFWKKSFVWRGRANLPEYWWPYLFNYVIAFVLGFIFGMLAVFLGDKKIAYLAHIFSLATFFPTLSVSVRRFHDLGKSAMVAFTPIWLMLGIALVALYDVFGRYMAGNANTEIGTVKVIFYVIAGFALIIVSIIWFVFLILPGQKTPNRYGNPR